MKKSLFIIAATALVISCANNDVKNDIAPTPIGFTKVYIENGTKAFQTGAYTAANFETEGNTFAVYGFKTTATQTNARVFNNKVVTYTSGLTTSTNGYESTTDWAYSPLVYWDKTATEYHFYAYAPDDSKFTGSVAFTTDNVPSSFSISGFEQTHAQSTMIDLMTDMTSKGGTNKVTGNSIGTNDVAFTFGHILSNINLEMALSAALKADYAANPVTVLSVSLGAIKMNGSYAYATNAYAWTLATGANQATATFAGTLSGTSPNQYVFDSNALKAVSNDAQDNYGFTAVPAMTDLLFVPQAVDADYAITVQYKIGSELFDKTIALSEFKNNNASLATWAPGYKYTYRIVIGPTPILFDITDVSEWGDGGVYTYTIE